MKCQSCGANNKQKNTYCAKCGEKIVPEENKKLGTDKAGSKTGKPIFGNKAKWVAIIAGVVVIALLAMLITPVFAPISNVAKIDFIEIEETPDIAELALSSPYYYTPIDIPGEKSQQQQKYISLLIRDSLDTADLLMADFDDVRDEYYQLLDLTILVLSMCDETLGTSYLKEVDLLAELERLQSNFEMAKVGFESNKIKDYGYAPINADIVNNKISSAVTAGGYIDQAFMTVAYMSAVVIEEQKDTEDKAINRQLKKLDAFLNKTNSYQKIENIAIYTDVIFELRDYIEIAKIEVALENLYYVEEHIPVITENILTFREMQEITEAEKQAIELSAYYLISFCDMELKALESSLETLEISDKDQYYLFNAENILITRAHADSFSNWGNTISAKSAKKTRSESKPSGGIWASIKSMAGTAVNTAGNAAGKAWQGVKSGAKYTRNLVGYAVDSTGTAVYGLSRELSGRYYGNSRTEIMDDVKENHNNYIQRIATDKTGSLEFEAAQAYFDGAGQLAGEGAGIILGGIESGLSDAVYKVTGYKIPNTGTGKWIGTQMGSIAAGTFTALGAGLSRICNPNATQGQINKGLFEIATSFIGGSSNVFSATSAGRTVMTKTSGFVEKFFTFGNKQISKNVMTKAGTTAATAFGKTVGKSMNKLSSSILKTKTGQRIAGNFGKVVANVKELLKKPKTQEIFSGGVDLVGDSVNHLVNSYVDNNIANVLEYMYDEMEDGELPLKSGEQVPIDAVQLVYLPDDFNWDYEFESEEVTNDTDSEDNEDELLAKDFGLVSEEEATSTEDSAEAYDIEFEEDWWDWQAFNQTEMNEERTKAKYQWVLYDIVHPEPNNYKHDAGYMKSEYLNGYTYLQSESYPIGDSFSGSFFYFGTKWTPLKETYFDGEQINIKIASTCKYTGSGEAFAGSRMFHVNFDNLFTDGSSLSTIIDGVDCGVNESVSKEFVLALPSSNSESEGAIMEITDPGTSRYYYRLEKR